MAIAWWIRALLIIALSFGLYLIGVEYSEFLALIAILLYLEFRVRKTKKKEEY